MLMSSPGSKLLVLLPTSVQYNSGPVTSSPHVATRTKIM
jgi:hypothetical protein